jgi:hypothetical protein
MPADKHSRAHNITAVTTVTTGSYLVVAGLAVATITSSPVESSDSAVGNGMISIDRYPALREILVVV